MQTNKPKDLQPEEWIRRADEDRAAAEALLHSKEVSGSIVAFHLQQMAEKYLKAYLVFKTDKYPRIHFLDALWEQCKSLDDSLLQIRNEVIELEPFYTPGRYPGDYPEISLKEAEELMFKAEKIKVLILSLINIRP